MTPHKPKQLERKNKQNWQIIDDLILKVIPKIGFAVDSEVLRPEGTIVIQLPA